jgi:hypothetical protein
MPFGHHPANLALRFLLELCALIGMGRLGWQSANGASRWVLCLLIPGFFAVMWGVLAVPGDPSRSGNAPLAVRGWLRLLVEAGFFGFAAWAYFRTQAEALAVALIMLTCVHYALSVDRIRWLLTR